jgi:hypothetical protein
MKASRDHYQNQAGEAVRLVKARDREIDKLRRELKQAKKKHGCFDPAAPGCECRGAAANG